MSARTVLITGVSGFIGAEIARTALDVGLNVVGIDIAPSCPIEADSLHYEQLSFLQDPFPQDIFEGVDAVIHSASTTRPGPALKDYISDIGENVVGTLKLYERVIACGVGKFIFLSSGGTVYGSGHATHPILEGANCNPINYYGLSKLTVESYLQQASSTAPQSLGIARIANPFGSTQRAGMGQGLIATVISRIAAEETVTVWGDGSAIRDYVPSGDIARGIIQLASYEGEHQIFNLGSGVGRTILQVIDAASEAVGKPARIEYQASRSVDVPYNVLDVQRARIELGYSPETDLVAAMRSMLER